jgi:class 3 adenylate cyclase
VGPALTLGAADRPLGNLAVLEGRLDDGVRHFDAALALEERMRARGYLPRTQIDAARALLARGGPGDRARARQLLDAALATSQELGLKGWLDQGLELKLAAQGLDSSSVSARATIDAIAESVGARRPDLSLHAADDGTVTLVFSDMEGFTAMTERLGDRRAHAVIQRHHAIVREATTRHGGREVELQGDGFLLAFADPKRAARCAIAIQRALAVHNDAHPDEPIRVRIGLHTGEAIREAGRLFGLTVILAARVAAEAKGGQILASSALRERAQDAPDLGFSSEREVRLKGVSAPQTLYEIPWSAGPGR